MNVSQGRDLAVAGSRALVEHEQRAIEAYVRRECVDVPPGERALMIGPHPDDNLLGAGGSTLALLERGKFVAWICVTDGRACVADRAERARMAQVRPAEEEACARSLGVTKLTQLRVPEERLPEAEQGERVVAAIADALRQLAPDSVYLPWVLETHPLHRLTAHLGARAIERAAWTGTVYSWAIGSFVPPRLVVDLEHRIERKQEAMRCYASQLPFRDYVGEMADLHHLQAGFSPRPIRFGELLYPLPAAEYAAFALSLALDDPRSLAAGPQPMVPERG